MREFRGIPVSSGIAIGRVFLLDDVRVRVPRRSIQDAQVASEQARLAEAVEASKMELDFSRLEAEQTLGAEAAKIFGFHLGMLSDKALTGPMAKRIDTEKVTAEYAAQEQFRAVAAMFARMKDATLQTKVDDVWDLERRVLRRLIGEHASALSRLDHEAVVIAHDLTPSQAAAFDRRHVLGFATDMGGQTSHTAIFARALEIPAVVGMGALSEAAEAGDVIILDGDRGVAILRPDEETLEQYRGYKQQKASFDLSLGELRDLPAVTQDGVAIELLGNIEFAREVENIREDGGRGVGLFRTEFLWLTRDTEPTEEEQFLEYKAAVENAAGLPVTLRTFDLGADKYTQERALNPERNPFLGLRSIRYCLQNVTMFKRQLRAIMRASAFGNLKIMFPLVTSTFELRQAKMILNDVREDLAEEGVAFDRGVKIGIMIETPAAAVMASSFAREVDFFSIGTNDLVQYTLAVDRTNEKVAPLYTPAHPAVIRLIKDVVRSARRAEVDVSLCGEVAGDPEYTMLLLGLGLRTLSVTPSRIPYLKRVVRSVD
ncbi:MAG: phosphoenolpyruvate--protein phosphotransferase, partial [Planctomycetes bacterium]|nr:phosphoenolpyruvate--protein phosphotransferase [Planctomycetota bacterium]